jgi:hypothetical protein
MLCCSMDLTGMKRIVGREAASQIAAASLASFLPVAPWLRYGLTSWAEMMRASRPKPMSLRAQWCALELASMATMQPAGSLTHQSTNLSRARARLVSTRPAASTA